MRKLRLCLAVFLSGIVFSCEDVIDVEVPPTDERLIIDASFSVEIDDNEVIAEGGVRLSLSTNFFAEEIPPVNDATVFITDLSENTIFTFEEIEDSGFYIPSDNTLAPNPSSQFELTVIYNNETYTSTTQLIPTAQITNISQGDGTLFGGDETEIIIEYADDGTRDDFYLLDFGLNNLLTTEDEFYQGEIFVFSYFYEDVEPGDVITVKINGITEQFFNYIDILIEQSGQGGGGPFATPPSTARGNIVNSTNPDNFPLGYFSISEVDSQSFVIE